MKMTVNEWARVIRALKTEAQYQHQKRNVTEGAAAREHYAEGARCTELCERIEAERMS